MEKLTLEKKKNDSMLLRKQVHWQALAGQNVELW
jgi:hypothetical protein